MRSLRDACVLIVLAMFVSCSGSSDPTRVDRASIRGHVVEEGNGAPLSGVTVTCDFVSETSHPKDGSFEIRQVRTGTRTLTASKNGWQTWKSPLTVSIPYVRATIEMSVAEGAGTASGHVRAADGGGGVPGATVDLATSSTVTDASGYFELSSLPEGDYPIRVSKWSLDGVGRENYLDHRDTISTRPGTPPYDVNLEFMFGEGCWETRSYSCVGGPADLCTDPDRVRYIRPFRSGADFILAISRIDSADRDFCRPSGDSMSNETNFYRNVVWTGPRTLRSSQRVYSDVACSVVHPDDGGSYAWYDCDWSFDRGRGEGRCHYSHMEWDTSIPEHQICENRVESYSYDITPSTVEHPGGLNCKEYALLEYGICIRQYW